MNEDERKKVPARRIRHEIQVSGSRFITTVGPIGSTQEAVDFLRAVRREFPDATHHVPASIVGHGASVISHCHDDGEPSGTAGRPLLSVLQGSGLGDVAVVVSRYFGGVKLGTGGLVRAYSDALREALKRLPLAVKAEARRVHLTVSYSILVPVQESLRRNEAQVESEGFGESASLTVRVRESCWSRLERELLDLSSGRAVIQASETFESLFED